MALQNIRQERLKKLENIKAMGIDPYPASTKRDHTIAQSLDMLGEQVAVAGRIGSLRPHGKIAFVDLADESGKIQLLFSEAELPTENWQLLTNLDIGDFIAAQGEVIKTQAGQITVSVKDYQLLTKSIRQLPSSWYGLKDIEERLRKRYLDLLINPEVREMFKLKSKFWANMRTYMLKKDFLEVEMPILEPIPGGADARPFITHHNALDIDLYLRISLELPLKRLLVGGYEKVFEIGRVFRNEGIDAEHLQDYTQIEFYWAYADYNQLMDFVADMYQTIIQETFGTLKLNWQGQEIDWSGNWPRVEYTDLLNKEWDVDIDKMTVEDLYELAKKLKVQVEPNLGKGRLLDYIYKKTIRPNLIQPMFVLNHPVEVEPLAKRLPSDPTKVQRMQILAMGSELGKGFSELNDPLDQMERFEDQMKLREAGDEEAQMMDEDYVESMEYGMPPNAGFGISERLFSMLVDKPMRETIFFPTMKPEGQGNVIVIPASSNESESIQIENGSPIRSGMTNQGNELGITRDQACDLMTQMLKNKNLQKHGLAVEAIMRALCNYLRNYSPVILSEQSERENLPDSKMWLDGKIATPAKRVRNDEEMEFNEEEWAIVGLLHDADYELVEKDASRHTLVTEEKLKERGVSQRIIEGVKAHHDGVKSTRDNLMEKSVYAADELSGLITAVALVKPDKKLASVTVENVMKKFKEKAFAAGANREQILACEKELDLTLEEFVSLALKAMQGISDQLGL